MNAERNDVYTQWVSGERGFRLRIGHADRPLAPGGPGRPLAPQGLLR